MKKYKIVFTPEAVNEIKAIASWYNQQQKGLGQRFKKLLKDELNVIKRNPFARSIRYDEVRFAVPPVFPYAAHYTINEASMQIIIHGVLSFKQDKQV